MEDWASVYAALLPEMKNSVKNYRFIVLFWSAVTIALCFTGVWFLPIIPALIAVYSFAVRNCAVKKHPYALTGTVADKGVQHRHQEYDSGPDEEFRRFWVQMGNERAFAFSSWGVGKQLSSKKYNRRFFVPHAFYDRCITGEPATFVFLSDCTLTGYMENGSLIFAGHDAEWELVARQQIALK